MLIMERSAFGVGQQNPGNGRLFIDECNHTLADHRGIFRARKHACWYRVGGAWGCSSFAIRSGIGRYVSFAQQPRFTPNRALFAGGGFVATEVDEAEEDEEATEIQIQASSPAKGPVADANQ
jgi:hypothetical protein